MVSGSVLILTAGFGEGHNAAARNLEQALRESHPEMAVAVNDIFDESYGWFNRLLQSGYRFVINSYPSLWRVFYNFVDRSPWLSSGVGFFWAARNLLADRITRYDADVVVSCFPGYGAFLDSVRKREGRPFAYVTVVTDSLSINSIWWRCTSDFFLVPNEPTAKSLEQGGVAREKIRVTGFPVPAVFSDTLPDCRNPPADGCWQVLYMVNSAHHTAPDIVRELLLIDSIALTVTCGRDESLRNNLERLADEMGKPIELHGWTSEVPDLLRRSHALISKAGGATVQEALAARTPMIITQVVPGQEEGNARLLVDNGAGEVATTPESIANAVRGLFEKNGALYAQRYQATGPLSHPAGSREIANFVSSLCLRD
jgi:processive 1,2-diacylglycerol beta-glucosyltransferase